VAELDVSRSPETRRPWPAPALGMGVTRRRALGLAMGGMAGAVLALAGCGADEPTSSDGAEPEGDPPDADGAAGSGQGEDVVVYASPSCGCCGEYADYLGSEGGYTVDLQRSDDLDTIRADAGVPEEAAGCHTTMLGDYVVEGHVPLEAIDKLLRDRPVVDGISLPGMPTGSPGMSGPKEAPFEILSFTDGEIQIFITV
jgi:hypothetical protein